MNARRILTALAATCLAGSLLGGCSADEVEAPDPSVAEETPEPTAEPAPPSENDPAEEAPADPPQEVVIEIDVHPGTADDGFVGALGDVEVTRCEAGDGWEVAGTVTNPEAGTQNYRIYVSLVSGADTLALVQVDATVEAGETQDWGRSIGVPGTGLQCVLRVERAAA